MLAEQLALVRRRGHVGFTFSEWERRLEAGELPRRSAVITFDDGYASTLNAVPVLRDAGFPGTVFPVLAFVESGEALRWKGVEQWSDGPDSAHMKPLGWSDLEGLAGSGWEVGSHTVTHPHLPESDDRRLRSELEDSRQGFAKRLGSCETVCYTYGEADRRVAEAARSAGYLAGCTLTRFHLLDGPHLRPRADLHAHDTGLRLRAKMSRAAFRARRSPALARRMGAA
ncbi:MAG: polysaccharide deacetylase family protein [Solirubrobacterales bacterium]